MSKEGKRPGPNDCQIFNFPVERVKTPEQREADAERSTAATERLAEVTRLNNEAMRKEALHHTVETAHEPAKIVESWKELMATSETERISRVALRRIDMHLALTDPTVTAHMATKSPTARDLVDTLNHHTSGNGEPDARPNVINKNGPFSYLTEKGQVETGANERTRKEHERARLGVEVALLSTRMRDMLHILDNQIGTTLGSKLTTVEKACINDHLTAILKEGHWEHPTQDMAESFAAWEKILGDARNVSDLTIIPEPANFKPEPQTYGHGAALPTFKQKVPLLTNIINAPGAAWREFLNLLPGDNKKR